MHEVTQIALDEKGNLLLPPPLHERLRLEPGMILVVEEGESGGLRLRVPRESTVWIEKEGFLVASVTSLGDLAHHIRRERERRVSTLLHRIGIGL